MQVLLLKDVEGLGHAGDVKEVAGGFALNRLIPQKLAVQVTEGALRQAKATKEAEQKRRERKANEAQTLAARLDGQQVIFRARAGEGDRLYGSITNADIAEKLSQTIGVEVERRLLELEHPIKTLGEHRVVAKMGGGVHATVRVIVERAEE